MNNGQSIHLKGLNGIRAIAALAVVFSHIYQFSIQFGLPEEKSLDLADFGVTVFFTLSGYLITYLLLVEKTKFNDIKIKKFYIRRILRIWPLYYFYLILAIIVLYIFQKEAIDTTQLPFYFFLLANIPFITESGMAVVNHFWSLGVEEQFYLFWPWVVKKVDRFFRWVIWFVILFVGLKVVFWIWYYKTGNTIPLYSIHITRFHCMAIGACGAILYFNKSINFLNFSYSLFTQVTVLGVFLLAAVNKFSVAEIINHEIISVLTVFLIVNVSSNDKALIKLDNRLLNFLGKISYGIYVYHLLVIFLASIWIGPLIREIDMRFRYLAISSIVVGVTIFIAWVSYNFFEKPFLRRKDAFSLIRSSSAAN